MVGAGVSEWFCYKSKLKISKNIFSFFGGGGGWGERVMVIKLFLRRIQIRVSEFFTKNPNLKYKKNFFLIF